MSGEAPVSAPVRSIRRVGATVVRIELHVAGFVPLGVPDEGCTLAFPAPGADAATPGADPHWYTVRRIGPDPETVTIDVVRHPGGAGSDWADRGRLGDRLLVGAQGSWYRRPEEARWQLVAVDPTGLPACARIVDETPPGIRTIAVVEIPGPDDEQDLGDGADVRWVHNPAVAHGGSRLEEAVRSVELPDGPGYVYVAGEAAATRAVRRYLRHERGLAATAYGVIGYWRHDARAWERRVARSGVDLDAVWDEAEAVATDEEHAVDLVEERLGRDGLL